MASSEARGSSRTAAAGGESAAGRRCRVKSIAAKPPLASPLESCYSKEDWNERPVVKACKQARVPPKLAGAPGLRSSRGQYSSSTLNLKQQASFDVSLPCSSPPHSHSPTPFSTAAAWAEG